MRHVLLWSVLGIALWALAVVQPAHAEQIIADSVYAWPASRPQSEDCEPPLCIDGDLISFTWVTPPWHIGTNHIGLDFGTPHLVTRIRLWKDNYDGYGSGPGHPDPIDAKNLIIQYTEDLGQMQDRTWINVPNLTNGFCGTELMRATAVNPDGTVELDVHDSVNDGHGWASLSFDAVRATGVRITFSTPTNFLNHYKLHEFQVWNDSGSSSINNYSNPLRTDVLVSAYPNPAVGCVTLRLGAPRLCKSHLQIFDVTGRTVREFPIQNSTEMILWTGTDSRGCKVPNGIYFLRLSGEGLNKVLRIVFMH